MTIAVKKFGKILNGRPAGREAALVLQQMLRETNEGKEIKLDFKDVLVPTPSYADEFLLPLKSEKYTTRVVNASPAVQDTLTAIDFPFGS